MTRTSIIAEIAQPDGLGEAARSPRAPGRRRHRCGSKSTRSTSATQSAGSGSWACGVSPVIRRRLEELFLRLYGDELSHETRFANRLGDNTQ